MLEFTSTPNDVMELALRARSIRGTPLSKAMINTLIELCESTRYKFNISSASALSRKKSFFRTHKDDFCFFNQHGKQFEFDSSAIELIRNEMFMGIEFNESRKEATVYVYFPYDGAYR